MRQMITGHEWNERVLQKSQEFPVIVEFYSPFVRICRLATQSLEPMINEYGWKVRWVAVNVDEEPSLAFQFAIQVVPTFLAYLNGKVECSFVGAVPPPVLEEALDKLITAGGGGEEAV